MIYICAAALLVTAGLGVLSETFADLQKWRRPLDSAADAQARADMVAMGWHPPTSAALRSVSRALQSSHGVEILHVRSAFHVELDDRILEGNRAPDAALAAASVLVADELTLYPPSFVERSALRRVVLCAKLRENQKSIPSLPNYRNTLILDAGAAAEYLRRLLHHEVFHFTDVADDGEVLWDPIWEQLNAPGFRYGYGGRDMRHPTASALTDELPGFLTRYSTSALEEDKAEVFAFLMARPEAVAERLPHDPVLRRKVERIKTIGGAVSPEMTERFWQRVARFRAAQRERP